jgi:hypothetical protein
VKMDVTNAEVIDDRRRAISDARLRAATSAAASARTMVP